MNNSNGNAADPSQLVTSPPGGNASYWAMTKREYMATAIMPQLVGLWNDVAGGDHELAKVAVRMADALLLELAK